MSLAESQRRKAKLKTSSEGLLERVSDGVGDCSLALSLMTTLGNEIQIEDHEKKARLFL